MLLLALLFVRGVSSIVSVRQNPARLPCVLDVIKAAYRREKFLLICIRRVLGLWGPFPACFLGSVALCVFFSPLASCLLGSAVS